MGRRSGLANVVGSEKKNEDGNTVLQVRTPEIDDVTADHHRECDGIKFRIGKLWNITKSQDPWLDDVTADHHRECDGIKFRISKLWNK